jgi:DNA replication and repair protein RecF
VQIKRVHLKSFRCFSSFDIEFDSPCILIEGANGSGKTTILEAIHYLSYVRSFRTFSPNDLFQFDHDSFFIKVYYETYIEDQILHNQVQAGVEGKKKLVKVDNKTVTSYKELVDHYRVVTLTEDDLSLVKGAPEGRRNFIDQAASLANPLFLKKIRFFKKILQNRNSMLQSDNINQEMYNLWTEKLWQESVDIQKERKVLLKEIQDIVQQLVEKYFSSEFSIKLSYKQNKIKKNMSFEDFLIENPFLQEQETRIRRSLFGAHLDDIIISFNDKKSRHFASRGQQKLIVVLLKIAQLKQLEIKKGEAIFLLDDFATDFDETKMKLILKALENLKGQIILTCPLGNSKLKNLLKKYKFQTISLD